MFMYYISRIENQKNVIVLLCNYAITDVPVVFIMATDKNSHILHLLKSSENCRALCSEDCFSILDTAPTLFQLKIKEAL